MLYLMTLNTVIILWILHIDTKLDKILKLLSDDKEVFEFGDKE